jgi:xanthine/uracil permease
LEHLPELFKNIFSSGVATGGIAALILNIVLPETQNKITNFNFDYCPVFTGHSSS